MSLMLIRHGETALNVSRVLQPAEVELSERGHAQADALARRLAGAGLAAIVSSDLPRARLTADHIARATGLPLLSSELLRERDFGRWRGRAYDSFGSDPLQWLEAPPDGESMQQFHDRVAAAFRHLLVLQRDAGGPLAVVSHGLVVMAMLARHASAVDGQPLPAGLPNASLSIVGPSPPHRIELLADASHLDAAIASPRRTLGGG